MRPDFLPESTIVNGRKFVSADDLNKHIDETVPIIVAHGIVNNDATFSLGMVEALGAVQTVLDLA